MRHALLFMLIISCNDIASRKIESSYRTNYRTVGEIPVPENFTRINDNGFGHWLRSIQLKKDNTVYLFSGKKKENQSAQFAVLDVRLGKSDLQQCADAVMRLRAEYLRHVNMDSDIAFHAVNGMLIDYSSWKKGYRYMLSDGKLLKKLTALPDSSDASFEKYLNVVFTYCSTLSLEKELKLVDIKDILPGDVFIRGGTPGHAAIVMDVAVDPGGTRKFLLAQSYMPAQDIHLLKNPSFVGSTVPWYSIPAGQKLFTPEWIFKKEELRRF